MAAIVPRRGWKHHLLSLLGLSILLVSLVSVHNAVRVTRRSRAEDDDNNVNAAMQWWNTHAVGGSKDFTASEDWSLPLAVQSSNRTHTADPSSSSLTDIHPWLVRQQAHPANPTPCKQRLWHNNRTRISSESCFPLSNSHVCRLEPGEGPEGKEGAHLLQKIRPKFPSKRKRNPRILCLVYTNHKNHYLLKTIVHTWGKKCDGFLAMSDKNDTSLGALALPHEGPESYNNMWMKTRSLLKYVHDHYINTFDFFHVCGDDVYLVLENMRDFLGSDEVIQLGKPHDFDGTPTSYSQLKPLFLGAPMYMNEGWYACAGGSGYTLNQAALKLYASQIHSNCHANEVSSQEDLLLSECFWQHKVKCSGWNMNQHTTRYHGMDAQDRASGAPSPLGSRKLRRFHKIKIAEGFAGASPQSFAFHLKSSRFRNSSKSLRLVMMQRYEAIVYGLCESQRAP